MSLSEIVVLLVGDGHPFRKTIVISLFAVQKFGEIVTFSQCGICILYENTQIRTFFPVQPKKKTNPKKCIRYVKAFNLIKDLLCLLCNSIYSSTFMQLGEVLVLNQPQKFSLSNVLAIHI